MPLKCHTNLLVTPKADSIHFDIIEISSAISFELRPAKGTNKKVLHEVRDFLFGCVASLLA